jgi:phage baseplate assembly protein W
MMYSLSIEESITDILLTPVGSRVCLPDYGSKLHLLMDRRMDNAFRADLTRYVFEAIHRWEPRAKPTRLKDVQVVDNKLSFSIELDNGSTLKIQK